MGRGSGGRPARRKEVARHGPGLRGTAGAAKGGRSTWAGAPGDGRRGERRSLDMGRGSGQRPARRKEVARNGPGLRATAGAAKGGRSKWAGAPGNGRRGERR